MSDMVYRIQVEGEDPAETGDFARDLRDTLLNELPGAVIRTERADPEAQDTVGTIFHVVGAAFYSLSTLILILKAWQERNPKARLTFHDQDKRPIPLDGAGEGKGGSATPS